jgi:uncharacterized protein
MSAGSIHGRGFAFPPRLGADGRVSWSTGADNVRDSIRVILGTDPGERVMLPSFGAGLRGFLHEPNVSSTHRLIEERVAHALRRWEPRIRVEQIHVSGDPEERDRANVTVTYTLVATGEAGHVVAGTRLEG